MFTTKFIFRLLIIVLPVLAFQVQSDTVLNTSHQISDTHRFDNNNDQKILSLRGGVPNGILTVDETDIGGAGGVAIASLSSYFTSGASNYNLELSNNNLGSGLYAIDISDASNIDGDGIGQGEEILLNLFGNIVIGSVSGVDYFSIGSNTITGDVEFNLLKAVWSDDFSNPNESMSLTTLFSGDISLNAFITSTASIETLALGQGALVIKDDGPSIANGGFAATLAVDETNLNINASANFASVFSITYGTDGPGSFGYSLALSSPNSGSGLYAIENTDTSSIDGDGIGQGDEILLNLIGNIVTGSVNGVDYFTIETNTITGDVLFNLLTTVWSDDTSNQDEAMSLNTPLASDLTINAEITDADGDSSVSQLNLGNGVFVIDDDGPLLEAPTPISGLSANGFTNIQMSVDESLGQQANPVDNISDRISIADLSNLFNAVIFGNDGPGNNVFDLSVTDNTGFGVGSGLYAVDNTDTTNVDGDAIGQGDEILLFNTMGVIEGRIGSAVGELYFNLSNNGTEITLTQSNLNLWHPDSSSHNDFVSLTGMSGNAQIYAINLVQILTDGDGDVVSAGIDLTEAYNSGSSNEYVFNFLDDGPNTVAPTSIAGSSDSEFADVKLTVDESAGQDTNPADNVADRQSQADFVDLFNVVPGSGTSSAGASYGTDGAGRSEFSLSVTNSSNNPAGINGLGSGIYALDNTDTESIIDGIGQGAEILLFNTNVGDIEGRAVSSTGNLYFTVSNNGSEILLTQSSLNIWHDNTSSNNETVSLNGLGGDGNTIYNINLVQTITDADGDTDSASLNLTEAHGIGIDAEYVFNFADDGPSIESAGTLNTTAVLDESQLPANGDGIFQATVDLASVFGANSYGTDGPGSSSYAVEFDNTAGAGSGLFVLDNTQTDGKGASIDLVDQGNGTVIGIVNGTSVEVFTLSVDANGLLTFEYSNQTDPANIWHGDSSDHDDSESINTITANQLVVIKTATDADGDSASQSLDIGQSALRIEDDGPTAYDDQICTDSSQTNNVVLVIDRSGSMANDSGVNDPNISGNYTRMEVLQNSIEQLLISYEGLGTLNVQIVSFAGDNTYHGWFSADGSNSATENAMNILYSLSPSGSSDFDDALQLVIDSYTINAPPSLADNTTLYFLSDGNPSSDANKQAILDFESTWESFLNNTGSDITNSYAMGIGFGITTTEYLDVISYGNADTITDPLDPRFRGEDNTLIVEDLSELSIVLINTINPAMGNVLDGSLTTGGIADTYGTDSAGQPISFEHDGTVYNAASFGTSHTITTADGGLFTFYFEAVGNNSAGDFEYAASTGSSIDITEVFTHTLQDADGDSTSANLEICVDHEGVPVALTVPPILFDEDDLPAGNNDVATGDDLPIDSSVNISGILSPDYGDDGVGSLQLVAGIAPSGFSYEISNGGLLLTIMEDTTSVAHITLIESTVTTGEYSYEAVLLAPITHQIIGTEDNIDFSIGMRVIDANGTGVDSEFTLSIDDDLPVLAGISVIGVVEEEALVSGNEDTTDVQGFDLDTNIDFQLVNEVVFGSLTGLVNNGADGNGGYSFSLNDPAAFVQNLGLTSSQVILNDASLSNGVLTAKAGVNDIFSLEIQNSGAYLFTLLDKIDHHETINADNVEDILTLDFSQAIQFTDNDGDSINLDLGQFQIIVIDDTPNDNGNLSFGNLTQSGFDNIQLSVDESVGQQANPEDTVADRVSASNFSQYFIGFGADGPGSINQATAHLSLSDDNGTPITTGVNSGLFGMVEATAGACDFVKGSEIQLFLTPGGQIEGRGNGFVYFNIENNGTDVMLTQTNDLNIWHPNDANTDDMVSLEGLSDGSASINYRINLAAHIIDTDGDSQITTLNLTQILNVEGASEHVFNFADGRIEFCNPEPITVNDIYTAFEDITLIANDAIGSIKGINDNGVLVNDSDIDGETLTIVNPGTFMTTGLGGEITIAADGTFTYIPPADISGQDVFNFDVTDSVNTVPSGLTIDILPVNDAPAFSILGDVLNADLNPDITGTQLIIPDFVFDVNTGPNDESNQTYRIFKTILADPESILSANGVRFNNSGRLTLNFTGNSGVAIVSLTIRDNGQTTNGGENTSTVTEFIVSFRDLIFSNSFEEVID